MTNQQHRTWRGASSEYLRLVNAVDHNCTCDAPTPQVPTPKRCPAHGLILDQQQLNRLECMSWEANRLLREEGIDTPNWGGDAA